MRVLWCTNIPLPAMIGRDNSTHVGSGGWMLALLDKLVCEPGVEVAVACAAPGLSDREIASAGRGPTYFTISQGPARRVFAFPDPDDASEALDACAQVVRRFRPDLIHVHGTERFYGLLSTRTSMTAPVVVSLQGMLSSVAQAHVHFGTASVWDIARMHDPLRTARGMGPLFDYLRLIHRARRERTILTSNCWFMGRTAWDRACLAAVNPTAKYFHVPEVMRPAFYGQVWQLDRCERNRIFFVNANCLRRGVETLVDALAILARDIPSVSLVLAGDRGDSQYGRRLRQRLRMAGVESRAEFIGRVGESDVASALTKAHVFVIPSLAENSPNSLCEAQLVGVPSVASYVGGIPSLVEEGRTGLLFPPRDAAMLADRIRSIFLDDSLARRLGAQSRRVALERHDPRVAVRHLMRAYEAVVDGAQRASE